MHTSLATIICGKRAIDLQQCRLVFGLGLRQFRASLPVSQFCEHLAACHPVSFPNVHLVNHALDLGLQLRRVHRCYDRVSFQTQGPGERSEKDDDGDRGREQESAPPFLQGHELALARKYRLQHGDEGHFLVHLGIAQGDCGLPREHLQNLQVCRGEKVRVGALEAKHAHAPGVVGEGNGVEASHAG